VFSADADAAIITVVVVAIVVAAVVDSLTTIASRLFVVGDVELLGDARDGASGDSLTAIVVADGELIDDTRVISVSANEEMFGETSTAGGRMLAVGGEDCTCVAGATVDAVAGATVDVAIVVATFDVATVGATGAVVVD